VAVGKDEARLNRLLDRIERKVPGGFARALHMLRQPLAMPLRIPLGLLLVVGGIFSFLPVLGIWMLPLGLLLLAVDVPFLRAPMGHAAVRLRRWWQRRNRNKSD